MALGLCIMATTVGCGMALPGGEKSALMAQAGKSDPLKIGKAWQEFAVEAAAVDTMTAGKFDRDAYNKESNSLASKAQALKEAVAGRGQSEKNAVELLTGMYQSLLFDWYAMNSMITCYAPVPSPTEPMEIARGSLNRRLISLHGEFANGSLDRKAYAEALQNMVGEAAAGLDSQTQDAIKALLNDINE
jgi:hypothetical protein